MTANANNNANTYANTNTLQVSVQYEQFHLDGSTLKDEQDGLDVPLHDKGRP